jgi:hypothetical protein
MISLPNFALEGNQILHSKSTNTPYQNSLSAIAFVEKYLTEALLLPSDAEVLHYASDQAMQEGVWVELGTWKGRTINFLAALNPHKTIYGFDSFLGLPEDWNKGDRVISKTAFVLSENEPLPLFLLNVTLFKGWFKDTLPQFVQELLKDQTIAFVHVDCDLYSSAFEGLDILGPYMKEGTVLVFDELYNYPNYEQHEWRALQDFLAKYSFQAEFIAFNPLHEQVALRLYRESPCVKK